MNIVAWNAVARIMSAVGPRTTTRWRCICIACIVVMSLLKNKQGVLHLFHDTGLKISVYSVANDVIVEQSGGCLVCGLPRCPRVADPPRRFFYRSPSDEADALPRNLCVHGCVGVEPAGKRGRMIDNLVGFSPCRLFGVSPYRLVGLSPRRLFALSRPNRNKDTTPPI